MLALRIMKLKYSMPALFFFILISAALEFFGFQIWLAYFAKHAIQTEYDSHVIRPLSVLDHLDSDDVKMILLISRQDQNEIGEILNAKGSCFLLDDRRYILSIKNYWKFYRKGGDMSTVDSKMIILANRTVLFQENIIVSKELSGLQSVKFGWAEVDENGRFLNSIQNFRKCSFTDIF
ncbi:MAG: hypothetical protein OEZ34_07580 [Spirochaetia bacterium]|nr:hypothetical protein [Spirochaetia bacterium]